MKKTLLPLLVMVMMMAGNNSYATKWRVNNTGIQADFTWAYQMVNSSLVQSGDTVYFESSASNYGNISGLSKRLVIIGPGYFLGENDSTQANIQPAMLDNLEFNNGSQGSVIKGMTVSSWTSLSTSNITLERNYLGSISINNGNGHVIIRNYIASLTIYAGNNILIANNIVIRTGSNSYPSISMNAQGSAIIENNIFLGFVYISNSIFRNNICWSNDPTYSFMPNNCKWENNISAGTMLGSTNGNQQNVDMNSVFLMTGSTDGKYSLKPGSPAIGAGGNGTDCGVFGGNYPYVLSGMVAGPSVYYLYMDGNDVTVKAKSH